MSKWMEAVRDSVQEMLKEEIGELTRRASLEIGFAERIEELGVLDWVRENIGETVILYPEYNLTVSPEDMAKRNFPNLVIGKFYQEGKDHMEQTPELDALFRKMARDLKLSKRGLKVGYHKYVDHFYGIAPENCTISWWNWL